MLSLENLPKDFYQPNLHSDDPATRIASLERVIAAATLWEPGGGS